MLTVPSLHFHSLHVYASSSILIEWMKSGQGVGRELLALAESKAEAAQVDALTLMVGSFNDGAYRLYERVGFKETQRRPFGVFPGSDEPGEWILMTKKL